MGSGEVRERDDVWTESRECVAVGWCLMEASRWSRRGRAAVATEREREKEGEGGRRGWARRRRRGERWWRAAKPPELWQFPTRRRERLGGLATWVFW